MMVYCELDVVRKMVSCKVMTIAKYELISHVQVHYKGGYIWIWTLHLNIQIVIWCPCGLHGTDGGYIWIWILHLNIQIVILMSMWTSLHWLGGISESVEFICDIHVLFIFLTSYGGYIWSQNSLHLKSLLSLLILWALEHWTK